MTPAAFEKHFKTHYPRIFYYCLKLVKNPQDAEDLALETFVKAYLNLDKFDPQRGFFRSWLYKIATNICIDHLKSPKARDRQRRQPLEAIPDLKAPLERKEDDRDLSGEVDECYNKLTAHERIAVWLRIIEEYTFKEIAKILEKKFPSQAERIINRGVKKLKECLEEKGFVVTN